MRRFILSLLLSFFVAPIVAQDVLSHEVANPYFSVETDSIDGKTGVVSLPLAHCRIKVPDGFVLLNLNDSRHLLIDYWKNSQEMVSDVVGTLVKADDGIYGNVETAYVLSYKKMGFVADKDAASIADHDELLKRMVDNMAADEENQAGKEKLRLLDWAEYPEYDDNNKILSWAEYIQDGANSRFINCNAMILGREGLVSVNSVGSENDKYQLKADMSEIAKSIVYDKGYKYYDFNPDSDHVANGGVCALIAGVVPDKPNVFLEPASYAWDFIIFFGAKKVGIAICCLFGILFLLLLIAVGDLLLHPAGKEDLDSETSYIAKCARNLIARLRVFTMVYTILLCGSIVGMVVLAYATIYFVVAMVNGWGVVLFIGGIFTAIPGIIILFTTIGGIWMLAITLIRTLVHPIMEMRHKNRDYERIPISESENPALFRFIKEAAEDAGVEIPEEIYIDAQVNASAGYVDPIKGLRRKSGLELVIGYPLFLLLSRQEMKAIIGHEFGHFAQSSLREATAASYVCYFIQEAITSEDLGLSKWLEHDNARWRKWGELTAIIIGFINRNLYKLFIFVTSARNNMSRRMELMADAMGAKIAGKEFSISASYKMEIIQSCVSNFIEIKNNIFHQKNKVPEELLECLRMSFPRLQASIGCNVTYNDVLDKTEDEYPESRIEIVTPFDTHPSRTIRIEELLKSKDSADNPDLTSSMSLLSDTILKEIQESLITKGYPEGAEIISNDDFITLVNSKINDNVSPLYRHLLYRYIFVEKEDLQAEPSDMSEMDRIAAVNVSKEFYVAIKDWGTINDFFANRLQTGILKYCGKIWKINYKGLKDMHKDYIHSLENDLRAIDRKVYSAALSRSKSPSEVTKIYEDILYAQNTRAQFTGSFEGYIMEIQRFYSISIILNEYQAAEMRSNINCLYGEMKRFFINRVNIDRVAPVIHCDTKKIIDKYIADRKTINDLSDIHFIENLYGLYDMIIRVHDDLLNFSKYKISRILEGQGYTRFCEDSLSEWINKESIDTSVSASVVDDGND